MITVAGAAEVRSRGARPRDNSYSLNGKIYPTPPAFTSYTPARYLRPFEAFPRYR